MKIWPVVRRSGHATGSAGARRSRAEALALLALCSLAGGAGAWFGGADTAATAVWTLGAAAGLVESAATTVTAFRNRQPSVDVIAVLAILGALAVAEPFAACLIAVMLTSGEFLQARANARARRELTLLVQRAPRTARRVSNSGVVEVPVGDVALGDHLVVGTGEVVPVDGRLRSTGLFDESALTGEALPTERRVGTDVRSGVVNAGQPVELTVIATFADSTYANVVRLVEEAQASSAPFVRIADRFAVLFVPLTVLVAGVAWLVTGDLVRAVAVLVVATPCPLLLAAPIAIVSGLSRAANIGVIVKGGGALERLADGQVVLFDKTGTLTRGRPAVGSVVPAGDWISADELLQLAASLDQVSPHLLATAVVTAALDRGLELRMPTDVDEAHGYGLEGKVDGRRVRIGKASWILGDEPQDWVRQVRRRADLDGSMTVFIAVDGKPGGALLLEDTIRPDAPRMVRRLRSAGIGRVVLVTGDRVDVADMVGRIVGVDAVLAECDPSEKLAAVMRESRAAPSIMVGDGVNDAPALAAAGVGVALAARGATASSEAADVVLTVDRIDTLAAVIQIARRAQSIALQAVAVGMGLSGAAMVAAGAGFLPPAAGAVLQEFIDLLAIGIALRALLPDARHAIAMPPADIATAIRLRHEHDAVLPVMEQIRSVADGLSMQGCDLAPARVLLRRLDGELIPHEQADEAALVPLMSRALGGRESTASMSRTHAEIVHQVGKVRRLLADIDDNDIRGDDVIELRHILSGLYAVLALHNALELEEAFSLIPDAASGARPDVVAGGDFRR